MLDVICGKVEERQSEEGDLSGEIRTPPPEVNVQSPSSITSGDESSIFSLELSNRMKAEDTTRLR
jgi:hypothetical protein